MSQREEKYCEERTQQLSKGDEEKGMQASKKFHIPRILCDSVHQKLYLIGFNSPFNFFVFPRIESRASEGKWVVPFELLKSIESHSSSNDLLGLISMPWACMTSAYIFSFSVCLSPVRNLIHIHNDKLSTPARDKRFYIVLYIILNVPERFGSFRHLLKTFIVPLFVDCKKCLFISFFLLLIQSSFTNSGYNNQHTCEV